MAKILSSRNNRNNKMRKDSKNQDKNKKKSFLRLILLLFSMQRDLPACQIRLILWKQFMLFGVFIDSLSNTITSSNG